MPSSREQHRRRGYGQFCAVASALDVVGERWTLLVARDLLSGPKRYSDLRAGLPGIATDLLTARLRTLEEAGLVQRRKLPPPAAATVYELTERGRLLGPVIGSLARLGFAFVEEPIPGERPPPERLVLSLRAAFNRGAVPALEATYQLEFDGEAFVVTVRDGGVETARGAADDPDLTLRGDVVTLVQVLRGRVDADDAVASGALELDGPREAFDEFVRAFAWEPRRAAAAPAR